jgi:hypothetical protein
VPGWQAISISTLQQLRLVQKVWFGWLSAISQPASRVGEGWRVGQLCLHSVTQPYTIWTPVARAGRGVALPPLGQARCGTPIFLGTTCSACNHIPPQPPRPAVAGANNPHVDMLPAHLARAEGEGVHVKVQFNNIYLRSTCFTVLSVKSYGFPCSLLVSIIFFRKTMAARQKELGTSSQPLKRPTVTRTKAYWQSVSLNGQ